MDPKVDHYRVLGLPFGKQGVNISDQDIARAYRIKARELHPDKCRDNPDAHANFQKLQSSYEILKDEKARKLYDDGLRVKYEREHRETQYEAKRRKMVSELAKRERSSCAFELDPEEERTEKKLQEEIARIRAKHADRAMNEQHKQARWGSGSFPCVNKPPMKDISNLVGAAGHEGLESCVLEKLRKAASSSRSS